MDATQWTLTVTEIGGKLSKRPYHTWRHNPTGIEVQGEPDLYGRSWSACRQQAPGAGWEFLTGAPSKGRRKRQGSIRCFGTPKAAAKAALTAWGSE